MPMMLNLVVDSKSQISRTAECRVSEAAHYLSLAPLSAKFHDTRPQIAAAKNNNIRSKYSLPGHWWAHRRGKLTDPLVIPDSKSRRIVACYFLLPGREHGRTRMVCTNMPAFISPPTAESTRGRIAVLLCASKYVLQVGKTIRE